MKINQIVLGALDRITLAEMTHPITIQAAPVEWKKSQLATVHKG